MKLSETLQAGEKFYYPSDHGMALVCQLLKKGEKDILIHLNNTKYYLPKEAVDAHGIKIDNERASSYVTGSLIDPENKIVYLRYIWRETWVDRLYNWYCRKLGRKTSQEAITGPKSRLITKY